LLDLANYDEASKDALGSVVQWTAAGWQEQFNEWEGNGLQSPFLDPIGIFSGSVAAKSVASTSMAMARGVGAGSKLGVETLRRQAVKLAWKEERELVRRTGQGTRMWTAAERAELISTGQVKGYVGHHVNSVKGFPQMAGMSDNIQFVRKGAEHLLLHNGNWRNVTSGPLISR
jgi:hypothetical protein